MPDTTTPDAAVTPAPGPIIARLTAADLASYAQKQAEQARYLAREVDADVAAEMAATTLDMIAWMVLRGGEG
jgi:hypothetical protein